MGGLKGCGLVEVDVALLKEVRPSGSLSFLVPGDLDVDNSQPVCHHASCHARNPCTKEAAEGGS